MKKIFMAIALCLIAVLNYSCKSNNQKIAETYITEKEMPQMLLGAALIKAEIKDYSVANFNNTPTDTLYEWQVFEQYDLKSAENAYIMSLQTLTQDYKYAVLFDYCDMNEIKEHKADVHRDSVAYEDAKGKLSRLKVKGDIRALGYEFDVKTKVKIAGNTKKNTIHKIIFIMDNGEVYSCEDKNNE